MERKNLNILHKKVVTRLAEATSSQMGINGDLSNRGKLNPVHAMPSLLWYITVLVKE